MNNFSLIDPYCLLIHTAGVAIALFCPRLKEEFKKRWGSQQSCLWLLDRQIVVSLSEIVIHGFYSPRRGYSSESRANFDYNIEILADMAMKSRKMRSKLWLCGCDGNGQVGRSELSSAVGLYGRGSSCARGKELLKVFDSRCFLINSDFEVQENARWTYR